MKLNSFSIGACFFAMVDVVGPRADGGATGRPGAEAGEASGGGGGEAG